MGLGMTIRESGMTIMGYGNETNGIENDTVRVRIYQCHPQATHCHPRATHCHPQQERGSGVIGSRVVFVVRVREGYSYFISFLEYVVRTRFPPSRE